MSNDQEIETINRLREVIKELSTSLQEVSQIVSRLVLLTNEISETERQAIMSALTRADAVWSTVNPPHITQKLDS